MKIKKTIQTTIIIILIITMFNFLINKNYISIMIIATTAGIITTMYTLIRHLHKT